MNIIAAKDYAELSGKAATIIGAQILLKPDCVLGFATGSTPEGTYAGLVDMHRKGILDFSRTQTFNLDEYYGVSRDDPNSYYAFMYAKLFSHVNIPSESVHLPDPAAKDTDTFCKLYEAAITAAGGIDLQLLGIGNNGHIGFNEPDSYFPDITHHVKLTESTIDANSRFYKNRDEVPVSALSMGIGTIMRARAILMIVSGEGKREILKKALYGPVTSEVPASILRYHPNVTVIHDIAGLE